MVFPKRTLAVTQDNSKALTLSVAIFLAIPFDRVRDCGNRIGRDYGGRNRSAGCEKIRRRGPTHYADDAAWP